MTKNKQQVSWLGVLFSVLCSMVGIQSQKNRLKDFSSYSSPWPFIIVGMVMFLIFVALIIWIARIVAY